MATEFPDLDEVLENILIFLPAEERQIVRQVNRNWQSVVNEGFGIKLVINNSNDELIYSCPWATEVDFDSWTRPIVADIAFVHKIKKITFKNMVVFYNLIPVLQTCSNLETLCCREVVVDLPEESIQMPPDPISLPHLTKLELQSWNFSISLMNIFTFFTKVNFGQLAEIAVPSGYSPVLPITSIFFPTSDATTNPDLHPLIRILLQNIQTVVRFSFGTTNSPVRMKFYPFYQFGHTQLEEIEMSLFHEGWTAILRNQTHLKILHISSFRVEQWDDLRASIVRNAATLTDVKLSGRTFGQPWDCEIFQTTAIEKLSLNITLSPKTGISFLPLTLLFLDIDGPVHSSELPHILSLVNLEELHFKGLGSNMVNVIQNADMNETITLPVFRRFLVQLPELKLLSFFECSSNSLDWDEICDWCNQIAEIYRIDFRQFYYDLRGQLYKHGLSVELPEDIVINRIVLDSNDDPEPGEGILTGMCAPCCIGLE